MRAAASALTLLGGTRSRAPRMPINDHPPTLHTERLILRPFALADAPRVQALAGDIRVAQMTASVPHPYPDGAAEQWIVSHEKHWRESELATWAICLRAGDAFDKGASTVGANGEQRTAAELIGCISLITTRRHQRAELGYWIGHDYWGHGYCTEAGRPVVAFGFDALRLARIGASHLTINPASGRVMQKLGLTCEGTQRGYLFHRGQQADLTHWGLLAKDWRP